MKQGANPVSMDRIIRGEYCGRCHGVVAFPFTDCLRCHSRLK
jgi:c(7)-type cytochrome triheme protein